MIAWNGPDLTDMSNALFGGNVNAVASNEAAVLFGLGLDPSKTGTSLLFDTAAFGLNRAEEQPELEADSSTHMEFITEGEDVYLAEIDDETGQVIQKTAMPKPQM